MEEPPKTTARRLQALATAGCNRNESIHSGLPFFTRKRDTKITEIQQTFAEKDKARRKKNKTIKK